MSRKTRAAVTGQLFVAPAALIVLVLFVIPLGMLVWMSFQDYPLLGSPTFNGVDNYTSIPGNDTFLNAIGFTLAYTGATTVVMFGVSFILVAIANSSRRGSKFYRTSYFLPYVVGTAAATLLWFVDSDTLVGVFNQIPLALGIIKEPIAFLSTPELAFWTTIALVTWKFIGFQVIILLMGLQSIPRELYEAARVDGATVLQQLRYITIPFLRPILALLFILSVTGSLLAFDQFLILTKGGPDNSTVSLVYAVYNTAFVKFDMGKAAALSVVLLVALLLISAVQLPLLRRKDV
ncbi:carbohydrate ABC transporter permease [Glaciibacter superstes]|uniref:carbohydrate ABC transporter permease n=1 Tax=Glaciibacter superstes TaxID=501023 RepID=UPI0003B3C0FF|nr:sugar ABC transporter permease [Glaciibacter superstes]